MVDWLEELLAQFEDDEQEDEVLPDWSLGLTTPAMPPEQGTGGEEKRAGPEDRAVVRSAETDARETSDGAMGLGRLENEPERRNRSENRGEDGAAGVLSGGVWLDGTAGDTSGPGGQADVTGEMWMETALGGLAQTLSGIGRRDRTERHAGAVWPDEASVAPVGWTEAELEGTRSFAELDKVVRMEADSGVEWLYRQTAGAEWLVAPGPAIQAAGQAETEIGPAALTVEELDRAVRRDSRRYDGEMCIY